MQLFRDELYLLDHPSKHDKAWSVHFRLKFPTSNANKKAARRASLVPLAAVGPTTQFKKPATNNFFFKIFSAFVCRYEHGHDLVCNVELLDGQETGVNGRH